MVMTMMHGAKKRGFTLIELIVVIAILAVVAALGGPSFRDFIATQRIRNAASDLLADMMLARSEALRRNGLVTVRASNSSWTNGWTIVAGAETVKQRSLPASTLTVSPASGSSNEISFSATGRPVGDFRMGFTAANVTRDDQKRCVVSNSAAGMKIVRGPCS
jgi:type IV fimbrial biogenesis protein FimT